MKNLLKLCMLIFLFNVSASSFAQYCNTDATNGIAALNITASGENLPSEGRIAAFDNLITSKWLTAATAGFLQVDLTTPKIITDYSLTSAIDVPARDPKNFFIQGSNDGIGFTNLDSRTNEIFATRLLTKYYSFANGTAYRYYRLTITANSGDLSTQLAEVQFLPTADCVSGNVYNTNAGVGYANVPVYLRNATGTMASTNTNASGKFVFSTTQTPTTDFSVIVQPPVNTYFSSGPSLNLDAAFMGNIVTAQTQAQLWPNGAFINVNGSGHAAPSLGTYIIDNMQGGTPVSLDWVLKPTTTYTLPCLRVSTSLDGNGNFGTLSTGDYLSEHPFQPSFHPAAPANEPHPLLFKSLVSGTSVYNYQNSFSYLNQFSKTVLIDEQTYTKTSFIGTLNDATFFYQGLFDNTSYNMLNGINGGWRKTYGHTTGDVYDQYLAVNGSTSGASPLLQFTANITSAGNYFLNFFGKNANSFAQGTNTQVDLVLKVFNPFGTPVATVNLSLPAVTSAAEDLPTSAWTGQSASFIVTTTGTYTFSLNVPTTSTFGNDFYMDDILLSQCSALPVNLFGFEAKKISETAQLFWNTAGESKSAYFDVERSGDNRSFTQIGRVAAAGNTTTQRSYSFKDLSPLNGTNYYRLKQIDADEKSLLSDIRIVNFSEENGFIAVPNPATDITTIYGLEVGMNVRILAADGRVTANLISKGNMLPVDVSALSKGLYIVQITRNGTTAGKIKLIKK